MLAVRALCVAAALGFLMAPGAASACRFSVAPPRIAGEFQAIVVADIDVARDTGVNLAGDTNAMIAALESNPRLVDLVAFSLSEEHFQARQALKLAIDA